MFRRFIHCTPKFLPTFGTISCFLCAHFSLWYNLRHIWHNYLFIQLFSNGRFLAALLDRSKLHNIQQLTEITYARDTNDLRSLRSVSQIHREQLMFINKITFLSDSVEAPGECRQQSFKLGKSRLLPAPPPLIQFLNLKIAIGGPLWLKLLIFITHSFNMYFYRCITN